MRSMKPTRSATRSWRAPCVISGSRLMMRSASRSRSNFSRHICGPAKSQGRSPIRVDRGRRPVAYLLLTRSRCGLLAGPSWVERRHSPKATANGEVAPIPDLLALANGRFEPLQTCIVLLVPPTPLGKIDGLNQPLIEQCLHVASAVTQTDGTGQRSSLARMASADFVQTKGLGLALCSVR